MTTHESTVSWSGASGQTYIYWVFNLPCDLPKVAGNYIFAKRNNAGFWIPIYIGQTGNFHERMKNHHAAECILRNGATHVHAHAAVGDERARFLEETDIRNNFQTSCNLQ